MTEQVTIGHYLWDGQEVKGFNAPFQYYKNIIKVTKVKQYVVIIKKNNDLLFP